ncbi:MAG: UDP-N-acetylmuramoyl-L-alanine--D-glutamate ligase, partial [Planctomycetota bacterium]
MSPTPDPARLAGQQVLVLGLGAFGGGAGCVRALLRLGARVTVTDLRPAERLGEALDELAGLEVETVLGGHPPELFQGQVVVVNPAVPPGAPVLRLARERGCLLTTQVNLAARLLGRRSCAVVTGTHGKSTCAALAAHLLAEDPRRPVVLGGNLGGSLLLQALEAPPDARFVLELSSFQLERLEAPHGWPECVVLTSLSEDHLDRHGDPAAYWAAKRRAVAFQDAAGSLCLPAALPAARIAPWQKEAPGRILWLGATELPTDREGWFLAGDRIRERRGGDERELAPAAAAPFREPYR